MTNFPCKDCAERHLGCHDSCEKYQSVKQKRHEAYMDYVEKHMVCAIHVDYVVRQIDKQKKRTRSRW
jgi:hypothetical protein